MLKKDQLPPSHFVSWTLFHELDPFEAFLDPKSFLPCIHLTVLDVAYPASQLEGVLVPIEIS